MIGGSAGAEHASHDEPAARVVYGVAVAAFTAYALWGSLFPFDFHAAPLHEIARRFWTDWGTPDLPWSLSDLVSNVLLFVPIGLFAVAAAEHRWPAAARRRAALGVFAASVALSVGVELAQAFVSSRTPSIIDVVAESIGAACGIGVWRAAGAELDALVAAAAGMVGRSTRLERLLLIYCAAFAACWLVPADFTLRPGEIGDKYIHKRLLLPFAPSPDALTRAELTLTAGAAIPLGVAALLCACAPRSRRSVPGAAIVVGLTLVGLEFAQVPVFSRTTDGTALLAALAGALAGVGAGLVARRPVVAPLGDTAAWLAIGIVLWLAAAAAVEWWPFHLALDADRARIQTLLWSRAPFRWPTGALDVVPGAILAAAAGALVRARVSPQFVRLQTLVAFALIGSVFLAFEIGRVLIAGGRPTLMSVVIKLAALAVGLSGRPFIAAAFAHRRARIRK